MKTRSAGASASSSSNNLAPSPPPKARPVTRRLPSRKAMRNSPPALTDEAPQESLLVSLPTECLVEVLRFLEIHELLDVAWTCRRVHQAAQRRELPRTQLREDVPSVCNVAHVATCAQPLRTALLQLLYVRGHIRRKRAATRH